MKAGRHAREFERLEALRRYDILDSPVEHEFDDVVRLASKICETPIAVINLIDADRQWFKAETGLGIRSTPLETSICAHVILEPDYVEIADTQLDPRMSDNPLCLSEPGLRFYAGAILKTADGLPIGTLCVLDHAPRHLSDLQQETLKVLAAQVMHQLELRLALRRQDILRREIDHRVKNSLQTISSIIGLQASRSAEPAVTAALDAIQSRLVAIIAFHEELHQAGDGEHVELERFLPRLAGLQSSYCPEGVTISASAAPLSVSAETASAIGVIINEFVANALKHVYADGAKGEIIILGERVGETYRLLCRDGGPATQGSEPVLTSPRGLGMRIIATSATAIGSNAHWNFGYKGLELSCVFSTQSFKRS
jgi:two-component sensor histidine kinase